MPESAIGAAHSRVDGLLKVTGQAVYAAENHPEDLLHAVLVCSTISRGSITSIQTRKARAQPGVERVLTNFSGVTLPFDIRKVNFFGQPVAVVLATTLEQAEHAAALVEMRYAQEKAITSLDDGAPEPAPRFADYHRGDPEAALRSSTIVVDNIFAMAREYHNPMELPATVAQWSGDKLTVWDKTQGVFRTVEALSSAFAIPQTAVRVINPFVGGAFGSAGTTWPHQILAAFAARQVGRPVKLVLTRKQMYTGIGYRATSWQRLRIGSDRRGRIAVTTHEAKSETARYQHYDEALVATTAFLYDSPAIDTRNRVVPLDVHQPTFMRGPGEVTCSFALESSMDELAHRLGLDPIELRRRNEPTVHQKSGLPFSSRRLLECYEIGARSFGWEQRNPTPRSRREGGLLIGMGMASAAYPTNRDPSRARARINDDGSAEISSGTSDIGPGTYTTMTQVAADALGVPMERITFRLGDSALPVAPNQGGSKTMASVGAAVFTACTALKDALIRMAVVDPASPLHGARPQEVSAASGGLYLTATPERGETYQQILRRRGRRSLDTEEAWDPGEANEHHSSYAYGAVFAEVAVDEQLGTVRIRRILGVYDGGRIINPKLAHSQAIGGMVGGIGMALLENAHIDHRDGRIVNANLADYLVPVNADAPELDALFVEADDQIVGPLGAKGLGEVVIVGVPAAIANAVFNATGRRITALPIPLEGLL